MLNFIMFKPICDFTASLIFDKSWANQIQIWEYESYLSEHYNGGRFPYHNNLNSKNETYTFYIMSRHADYNRCPTLFYRLFIKKVWLVLRLKSTSLKDKINLSLLAEQKKVISSTQNLPKHAQTFLRTNNIIPNFKNLDPYL